MTPPSQRRAPLFLVGLFFGILIGVLITLVLTHKDTSETYKEYRERMSGRPFRPGVAPRTSRPDPGTRPGVRQAPSQPPADDGHGGGADRAKESIAKVHFMKKFVDALKQVPDNSAPSTHYEPLLAEGAESISCRDCHTSGTLDFEAMRKLDPGEEAVESFRRRRGWMVDLMGKWVARLNAEHGDRLTGEVTCISCHEIDPRDSRELTRVYPALMSRFVNALKEPPKNRQPASNWKPLLKDPSRETLFCGVCHGQTGAGMEQRLRAGEYDLSTPEPYASNKEFMAHLMEEWVHRLNREMGDQLVKTVGCKDCHETDPRR